MTDSSDEDDNEIMEFNIYRKIIDKKDDNTFLIKLSFRELLDYSTNWCFNRYVADDKKEELYNSLVIDYFIPWTLHAVYDDKYSNITKKILILDGQHRKAAIEKYIELHDEYMTCDRNVWIWIYIVPYSESENSKIANNLFTKINNNREFKTNETPVQFIIDLVNKIKDNKTLKKGIKTNDKTETSHEPNIHKKELNNILNNNHMYISDMEHENIIINMIRINHILSLKSFDDLYGTKKSEKVKFDKAKQIKFYLNLKKSNYPPQKWIKFIKSPDKIND